MNLTGKSILLIISGGIAAYKTPELIRQIARAGGKTRVILTKAGSEFVTPLTLAGVSGEKVHDAMFSMTDELEMGHIALSRSADLVVVAPATADLMAKAAHGLANDLASTALLATDKPVLMAPAMNVRMWHHPATQRNLATLEAQGIRFVGPNEGSMACGEFGLGRMAEPHEIVAAIATHFAALSAPKPLAGRHVLITAGPTHEPIDPVRYIANRSSGKQGYALAEAARDAGARVTLISGPVTLADPLGIRVLRVETAREMDDAVEAALPADLAIFAAAVADWRVVQAASEKLKKDGKALAPLQLTENPDILARIARHATKRPTLVVGFAAETEKVIEHATAKRARKGCDLIVANDVSPASGVMGGERNLVHVIGEAATQTLPEGTKAEVARALIAHFAAHLVRGA
jgi:phosphopantothenoylcysteine decarboxylase / phosphopantothenate---cysteine ligase